MDESDISEVFSSKALVPLSGEPSGEIAISTDREADNGNSHLEAAAGAPASGEDNRSASLHGLPFRGRHETRVESTIEREEPFTQTGW